MKCIYISGKTVKDIWLETILEVLKNGVQIKTEYDKPEDPPSRDVTAMLEITNPLSEPVLIKGNKTYLIKSQHGNRYLAYGHPADTLLIESIKNGYIEEMLDGTNDHFIKKSTKSFPYTYHDRIFNYTAFGVEDYYKGDFYEKHLLYDLPRVDQIQQIIDKLLNNPYSRRAQGITWRPYSDHLHSYPPCLQRIWCRIIENKLVMETTWRSRDLFKAWSANVNAMIKIQELIAFKLNVEMGSYIDFSNSLHIYGKDFKVLKDVLLRIYNKDDYSYKIEGLFYDVNTLLEEQIK